MANTLTNLIPDAYVALDVVARELVGFIPSVARDPAADRVALGQTLRVGQAPANTAGNDITPAMAFPSAAYQTFGNKTFTISKSRYFPFSWWGSEQRAVNQGPGLLTLQQDQIAQAFRAAINEMEADIGAAAYKGASRAYGSSGTTPFASDLTPTANLKKILDDNGAPSSDRHLTIDTTAGVKVRTLTQLTDVNRGGSDAALRMGELLNVHGFAFHESAQVQSHTKGTGTSYVFNGTHAVGATVITPKTGSGTILAGDVVVFEDDTNKYVVTTALDTTFTIAAPGLLQQQTDGKTITIQNNFTGNVAYNRNAVLLGTRLPDLPEEGDMALDRYTITDPITGISFELAVYPGLRMVTYWVAINWGVSVIKPEFVAILLG